MQPYEPGVTSSMLWYERVFYMASSGRGLKATVILAMLVILCIQLLQGIDPPDWLVPMFTLVFGSLFDSPATVKIAQSA